MKVSKDLKADKVNALKDQLRAYSREPFLDVMSRLLSCEPDANSMRIFANQYPDRWATACQRFASLAGYHDKLEISGNIVVEIHSMGDAQLLDKLAEVNKKLKVLNLKADDYQEIDGS